MLSLKTQDAQLFYSHNAKSITEQMSIYTDLHQVSLQLKESQLISGLADIVQVYVKYALDPHKRQILFQF